MIPVVNNISTFDVFNSSFLPILGHNPLLVFWLIVTGAICLCSSAGRLFLLFVILTTKGLSKGPGTLIITLLVVEMIVCGGLIPLETIEMFVYQLDGQFLNVNCGAFAYFYVSSTMVVLWIMVCLALNRLAAVLFPREYPRFSSKMAIATMLSVSVISGLGICLVGFFHLGIKFDLSSRILRRSRRWKPCTVQDLGCHDILFPGDLSLPHLPDACHEC